MKGPDIKLIPIGVGGVLYPPHYFKNVDFDEELIIRLCPTCDDLWLKAIGIVNGYQVAKVNLNSIEWFTIKSSQETSLMSSNTMNCCSNDEAWGNLNNHFNLLERLRLQ